MIKKLLLRQQGISQLVLAWTGAFIGFFLLIASFQYFLDFKQLIAEKNDWLRPEYLIINKPVSILNSIGGASGFDENELLELKNHPAVNDVVAFNSNQFSAGGGIAEQSFTDRSINMYTDLFFESVPVKYLDLKVDGWNWTPASEYIPIILPSNYLQLYNFGYAPSQKLPQISERTAEAIRFNLILDSLGKRITRAGKIVGFSDRINTILVPEPFLQYGNKTFSPNAKRRPPGRVLLVVNDPSNPELLSLLQEKNYQTNSELLRNAELSKALRLITLAVVAIGLIITLLAFLGFIQYSQLALFRKSYEVKTLIEIGYAPLKLTWVYLRHQTLLLGSLVGSGIGLLYLVKHFSMNWISLLGIELEPGLRVEVIPLALLIFVAFLLLQYRTVYTGIRKLTN